MEEEQVSEEPTINLDNALEEIQDRVKEISVKYKLSFYELFGVLKVLEIQLIDSSKE